MKQKFYIPSYHIILSEIKLKYTAATTTTHVHTRYRTLVLYNSRLSCRYVNVHRLLFGTCVISVNTKLKLKIKNKVLI